MNKKIILFLFCCFTFLYKSQTLYWVGGSGNFNDRNHWSLTSGGKSCGIVPNANYDVVFDDYSTTNYTNPVVNLVGLNYCKSIKFLNEFVKYTVTGTKFTEINVFGDFELNTNTDFITNSKLVFASASHQYKSILFNHKAYEGDVVFNSGNWHLKHVNIQTSNSLTFLTGNYKLISSQITTGNFYASTGSVNFNVINGKLDVKKVIELGPNAHFVTNKFLIKTDQTNLANYKVDPKVNFGKDVKILNTATSLNAVCNATLSSVGISCSGLCDGQLILDIDASCAPGPYTLSWNNLTCVLPTLTLVPGPGSYTITNMCSCANFYDVTVFTGGFPIAFSNAVSIPGVSAIGFTPFSFVQPTCFGFCNGSITGNIGGSVAPYTVTVNGIPSNTFAVSAGISTFTNLCAGTNTFLIVDTKGCTRTFTSSLTQPLALGSTSVTSTITCNAACNGSLSLSPINGSPGYTVNFIPGGTFTLSSGGTASLTNLCPSVVAYTVTDTKGCVINSSFNITQPPALSVTATQTNVSCGGLCNAAASVSITGGIAPYNYTWTPAPSVNSPSIINLCAGTKTVSVRDANLCAISQNFTITSPPPITLTPTFTNASCSTSCNATASVSSAGGTGLVTFTWVTTGPSTIAVNSPSVINLCAGIYSVFARDAAGCSSVTVLTITQPSALTITAVSQNVTCFGLCNGAATITSTGGNGAPYSYTWSPGGQNVSSLNTLCPGNYTISIADVANCATSTIVSISQPIGITANITSASLTCNGVCSGSINAIPSGPPGPYTYTLASSSSTITSPPPYTNLCAGIYTVIIGHGVGCAQSFTVNIQQPNALNPSVSSTSITCFNLCDGTLAGSASGGTPLYSFLWSTPTGTFASGILSGQCAGNYTFSVTDLNGCVGTVTTTLIQPPDITVTIVPTNISCFSSCSGILSANVSGGAPGYTLTWSNGTVGNLNTGLCAGNYTLFVNDFTGCTKTTTTSITAPPSMSLSSITASTSCAGVCNGSATITVAGGTAPFTFQFNTFPITTNTTGIITGLCSGNYIVNVTDGNNCSQSLNFSIISPIALSAAITGNQSSCNACTGASTVTASNGVPSYSYIWTNSLSVSVSTNAVASPLCPGNYTVTITDINGCTATTTTNIVQTVSVIVVTSGSSIQCNAFCSASATVSASGGVLPYTYTWSATAPSQTTQTAFNLCAGTYTVLVQDQLGCSNTGVITFTDPPAITFASTQTNVACFGICDGAINSNVTGGTAPLSYSWSPGGTTTADNSSLCFGNYSLQVTDANGCINTQTYSISSTNSISATFTVSDPPVCLVSNGSICVTPTGGPSGGGGPYSYSWSPGGGAGLNTSCYSNLAPGPYSVTISDGACSTTIAAIVTNPTGPTLNIITQSITCFGSNTGAATVTASGVGPFSFTWTPALPAITIGNTSTVANLIAGIYNISVTDISSGCVTSQSVLIAQPVASLSVNSVVSSINCFGSTTGSITVVASGGASGYSYNWLPIVPPISGQGTATITNLAAGNFTLNLTDADLCSQQFTFSVTQPPLLSLTFTATNVLCNNLCNGSISVTAVGGTAPVSYNWLPVGSFLGSSSPNILSLCPNNYTLNVTDANNCQITQTVQITQPTALTSTLNTLNTTCSNSCNATALLNVTGGIPTYTYSWSSLTATNSSVSNLCAGNYTATAIDGNGCTTSQSFTITSPAVFQVTLTPFDPLCNAVCNGSISTSLAGAQGTVNFNWTPIGIGQNPVNLCANNYTLIAIDANGCVASGVVNLINPPAILTNITTTNPVCNGGCNGIAIASPVNAVAPITYSWSPSGVNSPTNNSLCAGGYTLTVQDANGCQVVQTFTLSDPSLLNVNQSIAPATCGLSDGSITVVAFGGTPAYTYSWSAPISSTNSAVSGLPAGIYTVIVSDFNNCTNTLTIPLANANGPSAAPITSSSISCNGQCTGAASVNIGSIVGGTPGYTVTWLSPTAPSSINPLTNLCAGTYTAQINDANNCLFFNLITINQPPSISIAPSLTLPTCNGSCNGSIILNTSGGVGPYNYTWTPNVSSTQTLINACAGNYTISIQDNNFCASVQTISLGAIQNMLANQLVTSNSCFGDCIATASVNVISGGTPPISYVWSNFQAGPVANNLCNGIYTVTATDANGCFNSFTTSITSPSQLTASAVVNSPLCGVCNGGSTVTPNGGTTPYTYMWTNGSNTSTVSGLCSGLYAVTIQDNLGCQITQTVPVNNSNGITGETKNTIDEQCFGTCNGSATVTALGGTAPIAYNWLNPSTSNSVITNLCGGTTYFVQMTDAVGCIRNTSVTINSAIQLTLNPIITLPSACGLSNGTINVIVSGGAPGYTYSWLPSGNTSSLTNIGAGTYTLTVSDITPCFETQVFTINNTTGPLITYTQSNINCFNACTGSITTIATSTALPISYLWSNGAITSSVTNLCSGVITLTVTDGNLCKTIQSFTITDNSEIQLGSVAIQQPACNLCNGSSTISAIGGVAPYTYTWSTGSNSATANNLCAGLYQVTVFDNLGCQITQTINVNNINGIASDTKTVTNEQCFGACTGAATVVAIGGAPPITYNWLSPSVSSSVVTNLCGGNTYFLQMTDALGCIRNTSVSITSAVQLTLTPTIVSPNCGLANGSISVAVSGGSIGYVYSWLPSGNTPSLSNIGAGSYTLTVTDISPCSQTQVFSISNSTGPVITYTQTNINCFNACTGAINAIATSTALPVSYLWSNGATTAANTNLCQGVITLTVTDANQCKSIQSFTIIENTQLQLGALSVQQPSCNLCNGGSTVTALGGVGPYTYSWTNGSTTNIVSNLCSGLYQVAITDGVGCLVSQNVIINNSSGITGETITKQNEICFGSCTGAATVSAIGGIMPITYNWINPSSTNTSVTNLCAGNYFVQMTDAVGCIRTASLVIGSAPQLTLNPSIMPPTACGVNNGTIQVAVSGGVPTYSYSWLPSGTTSSLSNIGPGSYTLTVTDQSLCAQSQIFTISNFNSPSITEVLSNINCYNACTGSITVLATTTATPISFLWSNAATTATAVNLCPGVSTLTVTDANSCKTIKSYPLIDNDDLQFSIPNLQSPNCYGNCNGAITLLPSGGVLPYTYSWSPSGNSSNPISSICSGGYSVMVTDSKGCSKTQTLALSSPLQVVISSTLNNASCSSLADGSISIITNGGTPSYTYSWSGPNSYTANTQNISAIFAGNYTLDVTDSNGCLTTTSVQIVPTITITANAGTSTVVCPSASVILNASNSIGAVAYNWYLLPNNTTTVANTTSFSASAPLIAPGTSSFELVTISSVSGCIDRDTVVVTTYPLPFVDAGPSVTIPLYSTVTIGGNPTATGSFSLSWLPAFSLDNPTLQNPTASNTVNTIYTVTVIDATTGCIANDTMSVFLYPIIKISNGFSPNGDSKNDKWIIDYIDQFSNNTVEVYNRWGELLFYSQGYKTPFDGKYKGKDLPVGTYYYVINLNHPAYTKPYTGPLTIFR